MKQIEYQKHAIAYLISKFGTHLNSINLTQKLY